MEGECPTLTFLMIDFQQFTVLLLVTSKHETIVWTWITCKNISCYMHDSVCWFFIVKKAKIFRGYVKHFWILAGGRKWRILIGLWNYVFWIAQPYFSNDIIKQSASFFFLLLRLSLMKKIKFIIKCYCFNHYNLSIL